MKKYALIGNTKIEYELKKIENDIVIIYKGKEYQFNKIQNAPLVIQNNGHLKSFHIAKIDQENWQVLGDKEIFLQTMSASANKKNVAHMGGSLKSPMPGKIFKILIKEGQTVKEGESLLIVEAMKMEHAIKAPHAGIVKKIYFKEGEQVQGGVELVSIEEKSV
jgi:biotin carboxyl carrier protein